MTRGFERRYKRWIVFLVACIGLVVGIVAYRYSAWPRIDDAEALIADATQLLEGGSHRASKTEWPRSIKSLRPTRVTVHNSYLSVVWISLPDWPWRGRGYAIRPNGKQGPLADGVVLEPTEDAFIFRFYPDPKL